MKPALERCQEVDGFLCISVSVGSRVEPREPQKDPLGIFVPKVPWIAGEQHHFYRKVGGLEPWIAGIIHMTLADNSHFGGYSIIIWWFQTFGLFSISYIGI